MIRGGGHGIRGSALVEFALVLPFLLVLLLGTIDFGNFIQTRLIITNVSREGGSIGSRQEPLDPDLGSMLVASGRPLDLDGADGKLIVTRIKAGTSAALPGPTIATQLEHGALGVPSSIGAGRSDFGLSSAIYAHLVFDADQGAADIPDVTVVEVYYKYRPITPLQHFIPGLLVRDGDGMIVASRAVF